MKKIKIAFLSLLATCTIASCDFLEKEPYKIVPENISRMRRKHNHS